MECMSETGDAYLGKRGKARWTLGKSVIRSHWEPLCDYVLTLVS